MIEGRLMRKATHHPRNTGTIVSDVRLASSEASKSLLSQQSGGQTSRNKERLLSRGDPTREASSRGLFES